MRSELIILLFFTFSFVVCDGASFENEVEPRGKKKKIGLFVFFADLIIKKIFVLKLVYAFILWLVIHKAGYFFTWFISYLKETKPHHHDHPPHYEYDTHPEYGVPAAAGPSHSPYGNYAYKRESWEHSPHSSYGPYKSNAWGQH